MSEPIEIALKGRRLLKDPTEVAHALAMLTALPPENQEATLVEIQDIAEQHLEAACARAGVSLSGLNDEQIAVALSDVIASDEATAAERHAHALLLACLEVRFQGPNQFALGEIIAAFAGLQADYTALGKKMTTGRKPGTVGKVRKFLRSYMAKHPAASTADAWAAIKARPPKGCEVYDRPTKYIFTSGAPNTSYRQFANLVSLERPK